MQIEFFLEEYSAEVTLKAILPKILPDGVNFNFHVFEGKDDLLKKLSARLKAYRRWIPNDGRIVVLVDEDREDCLQLKKRLERAAREAGFQTKATVPPNSYFQVVNRLAIEELEAWFFGDVAALRAAYPSVSENLQSQAKFRDSDAIQGGTSEALEALLIQKKYYRERVHKPTVAQNIAQYMEPSRNSSKSFQVFLEGLRACLGRGV